MSITHVTYTFDKVAFAYRAASNSMNQDKNVKLYSKISVNRHMGKIMSKNKQLIHLAIIS